jgi:uncharacterized membrane protein
MNDQEAKIKLMKDIIRIEPLDGSKCSLCEASETISELISGSVLRQSIIEIIKGHHENWDENSLICDNCIDNYRAEYVEHVLVKEKGELSKLESDVVESLQNHELLTENTNIVYHDKLSFGDKMTDKIVNFGGSWKFIFLFSAILVLWMLCNTIVLVFKPIDPYPFIFMNFILSTLAAFQAPFVLMSQNRQVIKERVRSDNEYKVNLKAELEIRHLNSKMDQLLTNQWSRLLKVQQVQTDLIQDLVKTIKKKK